MAAVAAAGTWAGITPLVVVAGVASFLAGLEALEPLAQEIDHAGIRRLVPVALGSLVVRHLVVPAAAMLAVGACGLAALAAGGAGATGLAALLDLVDEHRSQGATVVLATDDADVLARADRCVALCEGEVVQNGRLTAAAVSDLAG